VPNGVATFSQRTQDMNKKKKPSARAKGIKESRKYEPKVNIPLPFDKAVEGLLAVKPKICSDDKLP
jgi:hypothetical protein